MFLMGVFFIPFTGMWLLIILGLAYGFIVSLLVPFMAVLAALTTNRA
jgi:hypothetical protein